jgi:hypothetical protein
MLRGDFRVLKAPVNLPVSIDAMYILCSYHVWEMPRCEMLETESRSDIKVLVAKEQRFANVRPHGEILLMRCASMLRNFQHR